MAGFPYKCAHCGKPVVKPTRTRLLRSFCSSKCYHTATIIHKPRKCLQCKRTFNPGGRRNGNRNRVYCTRPCYEKSRIRLTTKSCPQCKKEFKVNTSIAHRYKFCSMKCKRKQMIWIKCRRCGERFNTSERRYKRFYCSEACRRPPVYVPCKTCRKKFRQGPLGDRQFCSFRCYRRFKGETRLEKRVRLALLVLGIKFVQEFKVNNWSVDFAILALRCIIEVDGTYWHAKTSQRDAERDTRLKELGWNVVRLKEEEIKKQPRAVYS